MTDSRPSPSAVRLHDPASRIREEFTAMPGMRLTFRQIKRLSSLSDAECDRMLGQLLDEGLLRAHGGDAFTRLDR